MDARPSLRRRGFFYGGLAAVAVLAGAAWQNWQGASPADAARFAAHPPDVSPAAFPELAVERVDGTREVLPAATGQVRVVNFWARWCGPCRRELPSLQRLAARADAGVRVQAVALEDDAFALREYLRDVKLDTLAVWRVGANAAPASLALSGLPLTFVVASDGRVLARVVGAREWDSDEQLQQLAAWARQGPAGG